MLLIDAHIHTNGISLCSRRTPAELIEECVKDHLDGIVLTNHCKAEYFREEPYKDWVQRYVSEFRKTYEIGKAQGIKVLFGIEVTLREKPNVDYVIYGVTEQDILTSPPLYKMDQETLFSWCVSKNALLYQAHPFRNGAVPQNPAFLHGVEINCHPLYGTNEEQRVTAFAKAHHLKLSCGSDFHGDTYKAHCGMLVPETVETGAAFAAFLKEEGQCGLVVHEIGGEEHLYKVINA